MNKLMMVSVFLVGCATQTGVTVSTHAIGDRNPLAWFNDGPPLSITVENHDPVAKSGVLRCVQQDQGYATAYPLQLAPKSEWHGIGQVMNKDVMANPCWFDESK